MKTLKDFNFKNKRVLLRCDFNVPLSEKGEILDDFKIRQTLPTINYLLEKGAKLLLMSHLGRPEGKVVEGLRLTSVQDRLMEYLDLSVTKAPDCVGPEIEKWMKEMQPGEILLLENIQFNPGEKKNDQNFAKTLASYADIFIMEAFGQAHRNY
ncbi:phosphoglycerate kinase, partial [candidate division WWE3 bacterium CG09_land_8_20_14_0_10_39_24]